VAIEDSATGMASANAAGLVCVGIRTAMTQAHDLGKATLLVNSLEELDLGTLEQLLR
jgi:beta-phosphoglucomutase-like phosphatase (HAD superfamily)